MVVVEFFDKDAIENIVSSLLCNPDKVIFVGTVSNAIKSAIEEYSKIVHSKGKSVEFSICSKKNHTLQDIVGALEKILIENNEITIDLTGGGDLYLVASGIIHNRYPEKVQLHRFNVYNKQLQDCDADGNVLDSKPEDLTVEENISIYGGKIVYDAQNSIATQKWNFTDDFVSDIDVMWNICRKDTKKWNALFTGMMSDGEVPTLRVKKNDKNMKTIPRIIHELKKYGLLRNIHLEDGVLSFDCKNEQVKRCFLKSGQVLELKTTISLKQLGEIDKNKKLNDVLSGVVINWNNFGLNKNYIINEIDVMAMEGLVPVFVSCKNGDVTVDELYKLHAVATRFGGKYAKKVLVATQELHSVLSRASKMNIEVIDNLGKCGFDDNITKQKLKNALK